MFRLLVLLLILRIPSAFAAVPPLVSSFEKSNRYLSDGAIQGGLAQKDLVLSDLRRSFSKEHQMERLVLEVQGSKKSIGRVGYYHLAVDPILKKLTLDLSGVAGSQVSLDLIQSTLKKSPFVADASLVFDPEDRSGTLEIKFNTPNLQVEAFELKGSEGQNGRLVIDISKFEKRSK